jgi:hypothetical protein
MTSQETDTKPGVLDQRWEVTGAPNRSSWVDTVGGAVFVCACEFRIAAHIVQLHNAELDRKTPNESEQ